MKKNILMPKFGLTMEKGLITRWYIKKGDKVSKGEPIFNVETDKITQDVEAEQDGYIAKILKEEGLEVEVKTPVAIIVDSKEEIDKVNDIEDTKENNKVKENQTDNKPLKEKNIEKNEEHIKEENNKEEEFIRISPRARKLVESENINLKHLNRNVDRYRIIEKDVLNYLKQGLDQKEESEYEEKEVSQIRKTTAKNMSKSWKAPHAYLKKSIIVDKIMNYVNNDNQINLNTVLSFIICKTIKDNKYINGYWKESKFIQYNNVHIGIATAIDRGLIVPVLKNAESYQFKEFKEKLKDKISRAKKDNLSINELQGATFTITNLGMYGIDEFTAVINPPQVGILSIGKVYNDFNVKNDRSFKIVNKINFVIGFDHRALDGVQAAKFLNDLEENIVNFTL